MGSQFPATETIFATTAQRFYDELSEEDKANFQSFEDPKEMVLSIKHYIGQQNSPHTARLLRVCEKIDTFRKAMEPFFKVIDIFSSSHPNWAAIVWGAIRLVFQLSSHFASFFEKLADMLDEIRQQLPHYTRQIDIIESRNSDEGESLIWREMHECLFKALSVVYGDILQFCHDACRLFSKKRRGVRYKASVIWDLFWTPFDEKFSEILSHLQRHNRDFEAGVFNVYSVELIRNFNVMQEERQKAAMERDMFVQHRETVERQAIDTKMHSLQRWIAAPNWTGPFEAAKEKRIVDTGLWILERVKYKAWLTQEFPSSQDENVFAQKILLISAKPGYGKTILSTRIIEHLQHHVPQLSDKSSGQPGVYFFYFDRQQADTCSYVTALRVVAAQLLYSQRHNQTFVDIAALMMRNESQGQMCAPKESLVSLIHLYLEHLSGSYLVFDGLDECAEWEQFLVSLEACTKTSECKIVLTARPHIALSSITGHAFFRMDLEENANHAEIEAVLRPGITSLIRSRKLGSNFGCEKLEKVIKSLAERSDSITLWAVLMVKYLQSPVLTPSERLDIIQDDKLFKGLEKLYSKILRDLQQRVSKSQHGKIHKVFEWLVTAEQSLTTKMLEAALAVQPSRRCTESDFMDNFDESLIQLCGPLVEIRQGYVRFIHLSVSEYLTNPEDISARSSLSVDLDAAHCSMAVVCLQYLMNEIPQKPLSGDANVALSPASVLSRYCFLSYVVSFWPTHANRSMEREYEEELLANPPFHQGFKDLLKLLSKVITDKQLVTVWIEASWTFDVPPVLLEIPCHIRRKVDVVSPQFGTHLAQLSETLKRLSMDLSKLNTYWGSTLVKEPNEIWLPSVNAFTNSEFWVGTKEAKLSSLSSLEDEESRAIISQVSSDGTEVGVIRVWPSRSSQSTENCSNNSPLPSGSQNGEINWVASYQIWSLKTMKKQTALIFEIPAENILKVAKASNPTGTSLEDQGFRFPVALSSSLRMIFLMGLVMKIMPIESCEEGYLQQHLFDPKFTYAPQDEQLLRSIHKPYYPLPSLALNRATSSNISTQLSHKWLRCSFSPCERYLLVTKGLVPPSERRYGSWILDIYHNTDQVPNYRLIASTGVRLSWKAAQSVVFHPTRPVVAICLLSITVLWRFTLKEDSFITIYDSPLNYMNFSDCGNFIQGVRIGSPGRGEPVFLHIEAEVSSIPLEFLSNSSNSSNITSSTSIEIASQLPRTAGRLTTIRGSATQLSATPKFTRFQGQLQVSALVQDNIKGSIKVQTMRADGKIIEDTITQLPQSSTLEKSYSTIVPSESDKTLRLVLNMAMQDAYSMDKNNDFQLPAVLDRQKESIPTAIYTPQHRLESNQKDKMRFIEQSLSGPSRGTSRQKKRRKKA